MDRLKAILAAFLVISLGGCAGDGGDDGGAKNAAPTASFTATPANGTAPLSVAFDAAGSSDADGTVASYAWTFGDGGTASGVAPSHTYAAAGAYTATLTVTDDDGAKGTTTRSVVVSAAAVNQAPTASFTATPASGTAPLAVAFNAAGSNDADGTVASYAWTFGDGGTASGVAPSHTYAAAGTYTATLTVTDDDGATATTTRSVAVSAAAVNQAPTASFTATPASGTAPFAVAFDAAGSSDADGTVASYAWTFGDGGTATGVAPSHTYTAAGSYTATLTVTDDAGATGTTTRSVAVSAAAVNQAPTASFTATPASGTAPLAVAFNAAGSSDADGTVASYAWTFGDGGTATGVAPSHTYNAAGTYTATLTVTDDDGATATTTRSVTVDDLSLLQEAIAFGVREGSALGVASLSGTFEARMLMHGFIGGNRLVIGQRFQLSFNGAGGCSIGQQQHGEFLLDTLGGVDEILETLPSLACTYTVTAPGEFTLVITEDGSELTGRLGPDGRALFFEQTLADMTQEVPQFSAGLAVAVKTGTGMDPSSLSGTYRTRQFQTGFFGGAPVASGVTVDVLFDGAGNCTVVEEHGNEIDLADSAIGSTPWTSSNLPCTYTVSSTGALSGVLTGSGNVFSGQVGLGGNILVLGGPVAEGAGADRDQYAGLGVGLRVGSGMSAGNLAGTYQLGELAAGLRRVESGEVGPTASVEHSVVTFDGAGGCTVLQTDLTSFLLLRASVQSFTDSASGLACTYRVSQDGSGVLTVGAGELEFLLAPAGNQLITW